MIHDISHCNNDKCKVKEQCYRWLAYQELKKINYRYPFSMLLTEGKNKCEYFIDTKEDESMDSKR